MAIASLAAYQTRLKANYKQVHFQKSSITTVQGHTYSSWLGAGFPAAGAAPTTAGVPTNATTGALPTINASGGTQRILRVIINWAINAAGMVTIVDRLSHQGGLSGTTTGAQTTNLPTTALTRYTSGVGVELGIEIYTTVGTTATVISASYTNTTPTSGRTTVNSTNGPTFGSASFDIASRLISLPLQSGDVGVTAVASVTLAASTLTAGAFGVTLYYPIVAIPVTMQDPQGIDVDALFGFGTWFPQVFDNACLQFHYVTNLTSTGVVSGILYMSTD